MKFRVSIPASTANLGPGFDALGMAINVYLHVDVDYSESHKTLSVVYRHTDKHEIEIPPLDESNLIVSCLANLSKLHGISVNCTSLASRHYKFNSLISWDGK